MDTVYAARRQVSGREKSGISYWSNLPGGRLACIHAEDRIWDFSIRAKMQVLRRTATANSLCGILLP